jgi:hypothetical protein
MLAAKQVLLNGLSSSATESNCQSQNLLVGGLRSGEGTSV